MIDDHDEIPIAETVNEEKVKVIQDKSEQKQNWDMVRSLFIRRLLVSYAENQLMDSSKEN